MFTRAAPRRHALRQIEQAAENLQLPWLCPALESSLPGKLQRRTSSTRPTLPRSQSLPLQRPQPKRLASAASATTFTDEYDIHDEYLPFAYESNAPVEPRHPTEPVPSFDLSNILMIDQTTASAPQRSRHTRSTELRGHAAEIEATLEACLQVQRWDRGFHILRQLSQILIGHTSKLQQIYNRFLEAMVFDLIYHRDTRNQDKINKWIEVYMRKAGVEPNAQTFALKIKVALATLQGSRRDRTVTRYWEMAKDYQFENQVASLRSILSDNDLGKLTEICPLEIDFELEPELDLPDHQASAESNIPTLGDAQSVRETEQKGLGLTSLRQALALFREQEEMTPDPTEKAALARLRQSRLEQDSLQSAVDRWKVEHEKRMKMGVSGGMQHGKIGALAWQWHESLAGKIEQELASVEAAEASTKQNPEQRLKCEYGPFLRLLSPQHLAALTTISVLQILSKLGVGASVRLARLVTEVGRAAETEVETQHKKAMQSVKKAKAQKTGTTQTLQNSASDEPILHQSSFNPVVHWTGATRAKVGAILCELMFDVAKLSVSKDDAKSKRKVTVSEPVFRYQTVYVHGRKVATVSLHSTFAEMMVKQPPADLIAKQLPMVSRPKPWTSFKSGGYLESVQPVLRVKFDDVAQSDYAKAAANRGDLDQLFAGLDVLGSTGWRVNRDVFDVMLEAWNSGEAVANLPPINKVFAKIDKPAEDASHMDKWQYYNKLRNIENERGGLHSNRCFQNFQMEIARSYLDETFYLPHNVDFRGRAYPIPPYLNQMGADNARGLLLFANGRELGSDGLRWLQIHLANVFGFDKASLSDRAQFAVDHLEDIRDSVKNPLNGNRWWLRAEDPWQCLATCHELARAFDTADPTKYVSHLPVHQDGTCNGLQHYAALGGDMAGARHVNLEPGDKPADVYSGVLELVKVEVKQDAKQGLEIAKLLDGRLTRKIVKQTVMTNVYGVTFTGAIRQVRKQVDDLLPDINESGHGGQAATYIARKIFKSLGKLFEGAHQIQYWLGDCANRITYSISPAQLEQIEKKSFNNAQLADGKKNIMNRKKKETKDMIDAGDFRSTVVWTTPLKLPVVQPYRSSTAATVQTSVQGLSLIQPSITDGVDPRKQLQAFPPNFVHSLDATHMMLSALKANELGLDFSAVHDSFWTHAADVDQLNNLLRDAFIQMHTEDIIGRLAAEFKARYKGHLYLAKIGPNNILAREIKHYRSTLRKKSGNQKEQRYMELVREIKRTRLLNSEDPTERAEGEAMVTAAALFEKYDGARYLPDKVSLGQTAVGEVPKDDPYGVGAALQLDDTADVDLDQSLDPTLDNESPDSDSPMPSAANVQTTAKTARDTNPQTWLWLPLTFRDVPQKGEFRVERLKDSTYFFS